MQVSLPPPDHSLIRFAQFVAEILAQALWARLGIGRFGHTAFLPQADHAAIAAELSLIEAITRRALFLIAALRGGLAPAGQRPAPPSAQRSGPAAFSAPSARPSAPRFALIELAPANVPARRPKTLPLHPAQIEWAGPPRAGRAQILPAARLVRRLRALDAVFLDPEPYILKMRRLIGAAPRAVLSRRALTPLPGRGAAPPGHRIFYKIEAIAQNALIQLQSDTG